MLDAKNILVAINGNDTDSTIVALAAQIARQSHGKVSAIYVIQVRRTLALDADLAEEKAQADSILDRAERIAEQMHQEIETDILQARDVATAIVEEAVDTGADLILLGIPYRKKFGDFDLGRTAPHVLKHAPCEVWVCREPMPPKPPLHGR